MRKSYDGYEPGSDLVKDMLQNIGESQENAERQMDRLHEETEEAGCDHDS